MQQLSARPARPPDYAAENRVLTALVQEMAVSPGEVLQRCAEFAMALCGAGSGGISVLEPGGAAGEVFRWQATAGLLGFRRGETNPRDECPCGMALARDEPLLFRDPGRLFRALRGTTPPVHEVLLAPWHLDGKAVGTLWATSHTVRKSFDAEDARVLARLADFAAVAYQMSSALANATTRGRELERHIADRDLASRALRMGEERLRLIVENARDYAIFTTDTHDRIESWWAGAEAVYGWPADEAVGMVAARLFTPEDREAGVPRRELEVARSEGSAPNVRWHLRKDNARVFIEGSTRALRDPDGSLRGFLKIGRDVTEQRRMDEQLRASEERLRALVSATSDVIYRMNPDWTELRHLDGRGLLPDTLEPSRDWLDRYLKPEDQPSILQAIHEAIRTSGNFELEHRVRLVDGSLGWTLSRAVPLRDDAGEIHEWFGAANDITARRRAEDALRESEARFRHVADSSPALIWMTDAQGDWFFANRHFASMFGRPATSMLGEGWKSIVVDEDLGPFTAAIATAFEARQTLRTEIRVRDQAGQVRWLQCESVPRPDDAGRFLGYTGCAVDITEARLAAEELERRVAERTTELMAAEETLRQAQKMEAVGRLTGGIAHDFNNMLQGVTGSVEMARRRVATGRGEDAIRYLDATQDVANRAAGLTRRLLTFARRKHLDPTPLSPDELVADMAELVRRAVGPEITVDLQLRDGAWGVRCDASELESAILNLCINARDAMPHGGRLTVGTEDARLTAAEVAGQQGLSHGEYVAIIVADTGSGIPAEVLERVFEPFFTTKPLGEGTGLGLSQVYGFTRQSGGLVRIESMPGQGTAVRLLLPRYQPAEQDKPQHAVPADAEAGGVTVLLVDGEAGVRKAAAARLRELGHQVLEAADGPAALRLLDEVDTRIDLLVTDVGLPGGLNGRQVAEAVREHVPTVPVLFVTGFTGAVLPPGTEVIDKPFELEILAQRVQAMLGADREQG